MSATAKDTWISGVLGLDVGKLRADSVPGGGEDAPGEIFAALRRRLLGTNKPKAGTQTETPAPSGPPAPVPEHPVLGKMQKGRAEKLRAKLSPDDGAKFDKLVADAGSKEKDYLTKSLAAGHTVSEIAAFAAKIKGKDEAWIKDNLSLTGSSTGTGVQQQWSHSCNATTVQAVHGELDPIYALKVHEDNPNFGEVDNANGLAKNPNLASDQKAMLESTYHGSAAGDHAGIARSRGATGGQGRWANDLLDNMKDVTGLTYSTRKVGKDITADQAIADVTTEVAEGNPVPIVIGNQQGAYTHYVLVTATEPGPPRMFSIHDPWSGKTEIRSEKQMKDGTLNIAGSNRITAFEKPTPVAVAP